ncbi:MAG: (d)CMP kinase [Bacteroidaceae bacterium]|nr:(d)CMP kinase [Bacteroidaceae bacterium]MBR4649127.1 (d)CMP kinase [Bacteroidaceae bacterium]MBR6714233.1 (d)CMP kinase [Bacteroidaceae bacterium]
MITIAFDGYSSCGKSTMARQLAATIGYTFVDTGAMYRAVTLLALRNGLFSADGKVNEPQLRSLLDKAVITQRSNPQSGQTETFLNGENVEGEIRTMEVSDRVSIVAALPFVRTEMVRQQQAMGQNGGIVMDGRDIGTTVFPNAEMKIFVTATPEVRAQRRYLELKGKGEDVTLEEVLHNLEERDYIDSHREVSPLRQAPDAVVLDNTNLTREEQSAMLLALYNLRSENIGVRSKGSKE